MKIHVWKKGSIFAYLAGVLSFSGKRMLQKYLVKLERICACGKEAAHSYWINERVYNGAGT